jgi:hypothetical protein
MPKKASGQPFQVPPAEEWNDMVDAGAEYGKRRRLGQQSGSIVLPPSGNTIQVQNSSGSDLTAGQVLQVGTKLLATVDRLGLWFDSDTPAVPSTSLWGVTAFPLKDTDIGALIVSGIAVASVTINDAQHRYCDVANGTETLSSGWHGARILYKPSGTGVLTCVVMLGELRDGPWKGVVSEVDGIDAGSTGEVTVWWEGAETTTPDTVQAKYAWMAGVGNAAQGAECLFWWVRDQGIYEIFEIEC